jgi:hypothetical protein
VKFQAVVESIERSGVELLPLSCLVCMGELAPWEDWQVCTNVECRYFYPKEMIAAADPAEWRAVQIGGYACTRCDQVLPNIPRVHIGDDGLPMHCPVPAPKKVTKRPNKLVAMWREQRKRLRSAWWAYRGEED